MKKINRPKPKYTIEELNFIRGVFSTAFNMFDEDGKKVKFYDELNSGVEMLKRNNFDKKLIEDFSNGLKNNKPAFIKKFSKAILYSVFKPMVDDAIEDMVDQIGYKEDYDTNSEYLEAKKDYMNEYVLGIEDEYRSALNGINEGNLKTTCNAIDFLAQCIMNQSSSCFIWDSIPNNVEYRMKLITGEIN